MAGDWIKWTKGLARKKEVLGIAFRLCVPPAHAAGLCMMFWEWLDDNVADAHIDENGNANVTLGPLHPDFIDSLVCASGFAAALTAEGWLCARSGSLTVPNYCRHNSQTSKDRALTAERVAKSRRQKRNATGVTDVTVAPLPEKRREEKNKPPTVPLGTLEGSSLENKPPGYTPTFLQFWDTYPTVRKMGKRAAWKAWQQAVKRATPAVILAAVSEFAASPLGKSRFCPGPTPWLNQDRWEDDRQSWKRSGEEGGGPHEPVDEPMKEF
ncbi:MAG: hypothetical protein LLG00_14880 [Planctomycetaceae bacterium]|nr:hypothetical protein [Planctomycetaceae bacterium]